MTKIQLTDTMYAKIVGLSRILFPEYKKWYSHTIEKLWEFFIESTLPYDKLINQYYKRADSEFNYELVNKNRNINISEKTFNDITEFLDMFKQKYTDYKFINYTIIIAMLYLYYMEQHND